MQFHILQARKYIESLPYMPQQDLKVVFRGANPLGKYLIFTTILGGIVTLNGKQIITAKLQISSV